MNQNYTSIKISTKDLRLFLRRINKCIRDLDSSIKSVTINDPAFELGPEPLQKLSDLIYCKAIQRINSPIISVDERMESEDPEIIINELI